MPLASKNEVAQNQKNHPEYLPIHQGKNNIEKAGFTYLNPIVKDIDCEVKYKT